MAIPELIDHVEIAQDNLGFLKGKPVFESLVYCKSARMIVVKQSANNQTFGIRINDTDDVYYYSGSNETEATIVEGLIAAVNDAGLSVGALPSGESTDRFFILSLVAGTEITVALI